MVIAENLIRRIWWMTDFFKFASHISTAACSTCDLLQGAVRKSANVTRCALTKAVYMLKNKCACLIISK